MARSRSCEMQDYLNVWLLALSCIIDDTNLTFYLCHSAVNVCSLVPVPSHFLL